MKYFISWFLVLLIAAINIASPIRAYSKNSKPEWKEYKSSHFIISYWPDIPNTYIKGFSRKCEKYYDLVTNRLGFNRFDFWLWENRAKIFVYETRESYIVNTGRSKWSGGAAHVKEKTIDTFYFDESFFDILLPHELTHIILREFIGLKTQTPLWFDEGVASANEKGSLRKFLLSTKRFVENRTYIPVSRLERMRPKDTKSAAIFYSTAASLIIFFLENYGRKRFVEFCKNLRDKDNFYEAMRKAYSIKNADELNEKFLKFLESKTHGDIVNSKSFSVTW